MSPLHQLCLRRSIEPPAELQLTCLATQTYHLAGLEQGLHAFQPVIFPSPNLAVLGLTVHSIALQQSLGTLTYRFATCLLPPSAHEAVSSALPGKMWGQRGGVMGRGTTHCFLRTVSGVLICAAQSPACQCSSCPVLASQNNRKKDCCPAQPLYGREGAVHSGRGLSQKAKP